MTYRYQLYKCPICGTVTEIVHDGVSADGRWIGQG